MADKTIGGRYEIHSTLGRGAMGVVYKAWDPVLHREAAIKVMHSFAVESEQEQRDRFLREARSAAGLSHPNIISIYDLGFDDAVPFIAMEYVEGEDLKRLISKDSIGNFDRKLNIIGQVCRGLHYAHQAGVIHRDIKPANILVTRDQQAKILDFGLARLSDSDMTRTGTLMGTPFYMSPEQARGTPLDGRSDLFSVGVILYELVTGKRPFGAESSHATLYRIVTEPHTPIQEVYPQCDDDLVNLVDRALAKDPNDRFADCGQMAEALDDFQRNLPEKRDRLDKDLTVLRERVRKKPEAEGGDATLQVHEGEVLESADPAAAAEAPAGTALAPPAPPADSSSGKPSQRLWLGAIAVFALVIVAVAAYGLLPSSNPGSDAEAPQAGLPAADMADSASVPETSAPTDGQASAETVPPANEASAARSAAGGSPSPTRGAVKANTRKAAGSRDEPASTVVRSEAQEKTHREAVTRTLNRYRVALEQRSLPQIQAIFPEVSDAQVRSYQQLFGSRRIEAELEMEQFRFQGEGATAVCSLHLALNKGRDKQERSQRLKFWMRPRRDTFWVIDRIEDLGGR